jgi:[ribosomal protein S5]-alanine N-acetyltransferase
VPVTSPRVRARSPLPLNTGRLQLLPMGAAHADLLARQERESGWAPDYPQPTDLDAARHLFESGLLYDDGRFGVWLIIELAGGAVIGTIGFDGPPQDGVLQIFYGIVPSRRGFGMAYEALHCLTAYAAAGSEVNSIEAYAQSDASAAVLRKAGYGRAGGSADTGGDALFIWEAGPLERPSSQASHCSPPAAS